MATNKIEKLKKEIASMEAVYSKQSTSEGTKKILRRSIDSAKAKLEKQEQLGKKLRTAMYGPKPAEQPKKDEPKKEEPAKPKRTAKPSTPLSRLMRRVKGKGYEPYKGKKIDLLRDAGKKAKAPGKKVSKSGRTYWESRPNRIDLKQKAKSAPYLKEGGTVPSLAYGDMVYNTLENALSSIKTLVKPQNYSILKKDKKYMVTTNRRSGIFSKEGWENFGHVLSNSTLYRGTIGRLEYGGVAGYDEGGDIGKRIDSYFEVATKSPSVESLKKNKEGDGFTFVNKDDNDCKVTVYHDEDSQTIVMKQDYQDGNPPEDDDISLSGFKKYLSSEKMESGGVAGYDEGGAGGGKIYDVEDFRDWIHENHPTLKVNDIEFEEFAEEHYENMSSHAKNFKNYKDFLEGEYDSYDEAKFNMDKFMSEKADFSEFYRIKDSGDADLMAMFIEENLASEDKMYQYFPKDGSIEGFAEYLVKEKRKGGYMAKGGDTSSPNIKFMKWYADWSKDVDKYVHVSISIPNMYSSPVKDDSGKIVFLDVIEKKGDADAKKYMDQILKKADEFGVSIYLEPIPRTHNLKSEEHKKKITKDYLIKYYQKFGFENTVGGFMVREAKMAEGGMMAKGGKTKKGDVGKSGTQYGYTLKEYEEMGEKIGLFVSPKDWWSSREGKKYTDSFGRTQTIGRYSEDEAQEMQSYGYRIAIGMDLGSDKIPASARKYVIDNNLTKEKGGYLADGGYMAKGGEIADIDKMKKSLIVKAKSKGIYENFGQKEVRQLEDKYGYTPAVQKFNEWAMNFDLSQMASGGHMAGGGEIPTPVMQYFKDNRYRYKNSEGEYIVVNSSLSKDVYDDMLANYRAKLAIIEEIKKAGGSARMEDGKVYFSFTMEKGGYMAKGGATEHGLMVGDMIVLTKGSIIGIIDENGEPVSVNIETGDRRSAKKEVKETNQWRIQHSNGEEYVKRDKYRFGPDAFSLTKYPELSAVYFSQKEAEDEIEKYNLEENLNSELVVVKHRYEMADGGKTEYAGGGNVMKEYEKVEGTNYELKIQVYYNKGGMNYFTSRPEARGYYVSVSPVQVERRGDGIMVESYSAFSGVKMLVLPVQRQSPKAEAEARKKAMEVLPELKEAIKERIKSKLGK